MMRLITSAVLTVMLGSTANTATVSARESSPASAVVRAPDPEHARLTGMAGTWDVDMTFWFQPGKPGVPSRAVSTIRPLFDGLFIEERIEGALNGTPFTTLAWTGYNPESHEYEATRIASTNSARIVESGKWDEGARRFELKASYMLAHETWTQRTVIQPISADSMIATSYLAFGTVPEWKAVEIRYTRRTK